MINEQQLDSAVQRLVVLISGSGTNLQALIDAVANGRLPARIDLVVSNRKAAYGLTRATEAGIPTLYFPLKRYRDQGKSREEYDADLAAEVALHQPDVIVLAGWMHVLSPAFLEQFPWQVINLHPALPGQFAGTHAIERAFAAFQRGEIERSGCMVHYAIPEVDAGEVIDARPVPILASDTLADFEARMHAAEHDLIVTATDRALLRQGGVTVSRLLARVNDAYAKWESLLSQIPRKELVAPALEDGWSVKDVIAHITWFEQEMAALVQTRNLQGSDLWLLPQAQRNATIYAENRERPLAKIESEAAAIHTNLLAVLETLTDADLQDAAAFANMPPDWQPWQLLAGNTYEHYLDHIPAVQEWLASTGTD